MAKKNTNVQDQNLEQIENAMSKAELFIEKYKNPIMYVACAIILAVVAVILFRNYYLAPKESEAQQKMVVCQEWFARDSFALALHGDGTDEFLGFENIVKDYKLTKSADLAAIYAGACCYHLGQYDEAIVFLKKGETKALNVGIATVGLIGDCYVGLGDLDAALKYFEKAAKTDDILTAPLYLQKAAFVCEKQGDYRRAIEHYTTIKEKYFKSPLAVEADKYIAIAEEKAKQKQ